MREKYIHWWLWCTLPITVVQGTRTRRRCTQGIGLQRGTSKSKHFFSSFHFSQTHSFLHASFHLFDDLSLVPTPSDSPCSPVHRLPSFTVPHLPPLPTFAISRYFHSLHSVATKHVLTHFWFVCADLQVLKPLLAFESYLALSRCLFSLKVHNSIKGNSHSSMPDLLESERERNDPLVRRNERVYASPLGNSSPNPPFFFKGEKDGRFVAFVFSLSLSFLLTTSVTHFPLKNQLDSTTLWTSATTFSNSLHVRPSLSIVFWGNTNLLHVAPSPPLSW